MALTGNNNHRSVLDDNASLFQIAEEKSEKQRYSSNFNKDILGQQN